jgi:hypothetical protein
MDYEIMLMGEPGIRQAVIAAAGGIIGLISGFGSRYYELKFEELGSSEHEGSIYGSLPTQVIGTAIPALIGLERAVSYNTVLGNKGLELTIDAGAAYGGYIAGRIAGYSTAGFIQKLAELRDFYSS